MSQKTTILFLVSNIKLYALFCPNSVQITFSRDFIIVYFTPPFSLSPVCLSMSLLGSFSLSVVVVVVWLFVWLVYMCISFPPVYWNLFTGEVGKDVHTSQWLSEISILMNSSLLMNSPPLFSQLWRCSDETVTVLYLQPSPAVSKRLVIGCLCYMSYQLGAWYRGN